MKTKGNIPPRVLEAADDGVYNTITEIAKGAYIPGAVNEDGSIPILGFPPLLLYEDGVLKEILGHKASDIIYKLERGKMTAAEAMRLPIARTVATPEEFSKILEEALKVFPRDEIIRGNMAVLPPDFVEAAYAKLHKGE